MYSAKEYVAPALVDRGSVITRTMLSGGDSDESGGGSAGHTSAGSTAAFPVETTND